MKRHLSKSPLQSQATGKRRRGGGESECEVKSKVRIMCNITRGFKLKVFGAVGCSLEAPPHLLLVLPRVPSLPRLKADDVNLLSLNYKKGRMITSETLQNEKSQIRVILHVALKIQDF